MAAALAALLGLTSTAVAAPRVDSGNTAWMLIATILIVLMTVPGLALFYGGLVRSKNVLSVFMQVMVAFCLITLLWVIYGYSLAFTPGSVTGGLSKLFLAGVGPASLAATFSKESYIPEYAVVAFQLTFAAITPAIIIGAFAERMKFSAVLIFLAIWFTFAYLPMAHMAWFWAGPDAYTLSPDNIDAIRAAVGDSAARDFLARLAAAPDAVARAAVLAEYGQAVSAHDGFLFRHGLLDFAGGTVVEVNSGVAGLVCALMVGPRVGYGREPMAPHNLSLALTGTGLLLVGWLGFNAGSALEANGLAAMTLFNTLLAAAAGTLAWSLVEWKTHQHPSFLGAASGLVAGLVAITPACGYVGPMGAIAIGAAAGAASLWAVVSLKARFRYDDSLDVFGVHGVSGIIGTILTGLFAAPLLGGVGVTSYLATDASTAPAPYAITSQIVTQAGGVLLAALLSALVSYAALRICQMTVGLRLAESDEREGLDVASHGERAYNG